MIASKYLRVAFVALSAAAVAFAAFEGMFGPGLGGLTIADAAPTFIVDKGPEIGGLEPVWGGLAVSDKISVEGSELPRTMSRAAVRAEAPLPRPVVVRSVAATSRSASSGWSTARVSWYGPGFYGKTTASGEVLVEGMMNCAHRTLPFGTRVQFEYNGRTCIAVVNDRGPYVASRTFDLGPGTATTLGFSGVGTVRYRILGR